MDVPRKSETPAHGVRIWSWRRLGGLRQLLFLDMLAPQDLGSSQPRRGLLASACSNERDHGPSHSRWFLRRLDRGPLNPSTRARKRLGSNLRAVPPGRQLSYQGLGRHRPWSSHRQADRRDAREPDLGGVDAGQRIDVSDGAPHARRVPQASPGYLGMNPTRFSQLSYCIRQQ